MRGPQQLSALAARVLARNQSQPGRDLPAVLERRGIADFGGERGRDERSDTAMTHQLLACGALLRQVLDLLRQRVQALLDLLQMLKLVTQSHLEYRWQAPSSTILVNSRRIGCRPGGSSTPNSPAKPCS